jgi:hypothetical protein
MAWYDTGTVAVTNGSTTVTGSGTNFLTGAQIGEAFLAPDDKLYEIASISSSTVMVLADSYLGSTQSGQAYKIVPTQSLVADLASDVTDLISDYATVKDTTGAGKFLDGAVATPSITFDQDQDTGFYRVGANELGVAVGGVAKVSFDSDGVSHGDNVKAKFGAGDDLQIYHDGSNSYIKDGGTGGLRLLADADTAIRSADNSTAKAIFGGDVKLYHSGNLKLATTSTGIDVTGTVTASTYTGANTDFRSTGSAYLTYGSSSDNLIIRTDNGSERMRIDSSGNVGIGTSSPLAKLDLGEVGTTGANWLIGVGANSNNYYTTNTSGVQVFRRGATEDARIDSSGNVGIGTSSPDGRLHVKSTGNGDIYVERNAGAKIHLQAQSAHGKIGTASNHNLGLNTNGTTHMTLDTSGKVGIGTSSPSSALDVIGEAEFGDGTRGVKLSYSAGNNSGVIDTANTGDTLEFRIANSEKMRIDSSGNVLVGTTDAAVGVGNTNVGHSLGAAGYAAHSRSGNASLFLNRTSSDGEITRFSKDGSTVGSIGSYAGIKLWIGSPASSGLLFGSTNILPSQDGVFDDNAHSLGSSSYRFDDIYATNGTIQTSDRNEKQDIAELSDAEQRVAVACKGLMRKFRWKDAVEEKGDDARIHFGIIAQDLQAAFEAEGLDAGKYAMFISTTWWEADRIIPAVEAVEAQDAVYEEVVIPAVLDEDGNEVEPERTEQTLISEAVEAVEAVEEHTVTDRFDTLEEAPEGATERTRMGVRYTELLAFIIGAI